MQESNTKLSKGLFAEIEERSSVQEYEKLNEKNLRDWLNKIHKSYQEGQQKLLKLEEEWSKHWKNKRKEYPEEEPPMWLVAKTHPCMNQGTGGVWMTSGEVIKENKKWLD